GLLSFSSRLRLSACRRHFYFSSFSAGREADMGPARPQTACTTPSSSPKAGGGVDDLGQRQKEAAVVLRPPIQRYIAGNCQEGREIRIIDVSLPIPALTCVD